MTIVLLFFALLLHVSVSWSATIGGGSGVASESDTLDTVFDRGKTIDGANNFTNAVKILDANGDGYAIYNDATNGATLVCVDNYVENACGSYTRQLASGQTVIYKNSSGTQIFTLTENTGAITNATINAASNSITMYQKICGGDLVGVDPATGTALHAWNKSPTATAPTATAATGTNLNKGLARHPDSDGTYGVQLRCRLPPGVTFGQVDGILTWISAGTGNYRPQVETKCYGDDEADDASFNSAQAFTVAAGTATRPQIDTLSNITFTGCAAGEILTIQLTRSRTEASDTGSSTFDVESFELWAHVTH